MLSPKYGVGFISVLQLIKKIFNVECKKRFKVAPVYGTRQKHSAPRAPLSFSCGYLQNKCAYQLQTFNGLTRINFAHYVRIWKARVCMGGGTGVTGGGTGPPQTFQRLTLCLWTAHGKNRLHMVLVPPPQSSRRGAALEGVIDRPQIASEWHHVPSISTLPRTPFLSYDQLTYMACRSRTATELLLDFFF